MDLGVEKKTIFKLFAGGRSQKILLWLQKTNHRCCQAAFNRRKKKNPADDGELYVYHSFMAAWTITSNFLHHHFWASGIWKQLWRAVLPLLWGCSHLVCLTGLQDLFASSPGIGSLVLCHVGLSGGLHHCPHYSRVSDQRVQGRSQEIWSNSPWKSHSIISTLYSIPVQCGRGMLRGINPRRQGLLWLHYFTII